MPTAQHDSEAAPSGVKSKSKSNRQNVRKKRTAVSCDRCKNRKTKCVDPVPGPCHYCASINAPCKTDLNRRKKRPYYHVSEEEYRCMTTILRHYLPDLEFNLPSLKALCKRLEGLEDESSRPTPIATPTPTTTAATHDEDVFGSEGRNQPTTPLDGDGDVDGRRGSVKGAAGGHFGDGDGENVKGEDEENPSIQEIQALQEQLGCLMIDSRGNYRHVGTDSSIGFNAAIRMIKGDHPHNHHHHHHHQTAEDFDDSDDNPPGTDGPPDIIIQPLSTTSLPPATPESSVGGGGGGTSVDSMSYCTSSSHQQQQVVFLPPLEQASASAQRYFDEVHCLYWLFSTEQFHERVHETYATGGMLAGASWLCCLYSIFAIGSAGDGGGGGVGVAGPGQGRRRKTSSAEYLVMAKALVPQVVDEADVDSVRALSLLALALQIECYTNAAYLYIGTAVRTAYSLGLHVERAAPPSRGRLERERNRRIWWTLYLLDYEMAHRYGNPCAVVDEVCDVQVQMPSEQILSPGPTTPLGYLASASGLCAISRQIRSALHHQESNSSRTGTTTTTTTTTTIRTLLATLGAWHASLPPHLSALSHTAPAHRRAVGVLHARYWADVVLVTRPFLLYRAMSVQRRRRRGGGREQQREEEEEKEEEEMKERDCDPFTYCAASDTCCGRRRRGRRSGDDDDDGDVGRNDGRTSEKNEKKKRRLFAEMSETCMAAAREGLSIMRAMANDGDGSSSEPSSLSSLVNFDCSNLLELVQVFRLGMVLGEEGEEKEGEGEEEETSKATMTTTFSSFTFPDQSCSCVGAGELAFGGGAWGEREEGIAIREEQRQKTRTGKEKWTQRIHEAVRIMRGMEQVGWTARALPELSAQLRECRILDDEDTELAPPLGMEEMMRDAMMGQRSGAGGNGGFETIGGGVEGMEVEDSLGAFFGDVLGDGAALGGTGGFGDTYNNVLFLDIDYA